MAYRGLVYRWGTNQTVSYTSTSVANSTAFVTGIQAVRVLASTSCHIKVGASPTATSSDTRLAANVPEYIEVSPGEKIAAIRTTTSGTLHVTEVTT